MAAELLTLDVHGIPEAVQWSEGMIERSQDLTTVFEGAAHRGFLLEMKEQFDTEGTHLNSSKWAPLSDAYAAWKQRHYPGMPILQRSGDLMRSLTVADDAAHISIITPEKAVFGSSIHYGIYHQDGSPKTHLPQRRIIRIRDVFKRLIFRATVAWVVGGKQLRDVTDDGG